MPIRPPNIIPPSQKNPPGSLANMAKNMYIPCIKWIKSKAQNIYQNFLFENIVMGEIDPTVTNNKNMTAVDCTGLEAIISEPGGNHL